VIRSSGADPKLAAEFIALNVEVMLAAATPAAKAAQSATTKIAIVMADPGDAVQLRLVASLARPGANITGVTSLAPELATKRLELLKKAFPKTARVAVLWNSAIPPADRPGSLRHSRPSCENAAMRCSYFRIL
jgi:putative tryptophan/tyrosine transport system substrate-binding protein